MSKRSKAAKKAAKAAKVNTVPGGLPGALDRGSNGRATLQDVDFVTRMRREGKGMDGYSGDRRGNGNGYREGYGYNGHDNGYSWVDQQRDYHNRKGTSVSNVSSHLLPLAKDEGIFCVESNEVTGSCPLNPKVPEILVDAKTWGSWLKATEAFNTEWIALLFGKEGFTSTGSPCYIIEDYYFPPQTATGTHVDVPTGVVPKPGVIGAIHSHVGMNVFFSATDKAHSNWPVEIVINRKHDYEAVARYKLKCGEWAKGGAKVFLTGSSLDLSVKDALDKAFKLGEVMEKEVRAKVAIVPVVTSTSTTSTPTSTPTPTSTTDKVGEQLTLTVPSSDDGSALQGLQGDDNHNGGPLDELIDEFSCSDCEGDGWVELQVGHIREVMECKTCGGTGLNAKGIEMQTTMFNKSKEGVVQ